jgi:tetratricopeptide (TPR) repeat protein
MTFNEHFCPLLARGGFYAEMYNSQFAIQGVNGNGNGNGNGKNHGNGHLPGGTGQPEVQTLSPASVGEANECLKQAYKALKLGKNEQARQLAMDTIRLCPTLEDPYLIVVAVAEEPQDAVEYLKKALEINPASLQARKGLAWAEQKLKASLLQKSIQN